MEISGRRGVNRVGAGRVDRHMGEVINLNKYRRKRQRQQVAQSSGSDTAKSEPDKSEKNVAETRWIEDQRESRSFGLLPLPQPSSDKPDPKEDGSEPS